VWRDSEPEKNAAEVVEEFDDAEESDRERRDEERLGPPWRTEVSAEAEVGAGRTASTDSRYAS
jgi:hypothetical protein